MSKQFLGVIIAVTLVLGGIFMFSGDKNQQDSSDNKAKRGTLTTHVKGQGTAGVTLLEYGDYQCPYCAQYYPTIEQVLAKYGDKIKFQFRNFPLVGTHQNAFAAARAAEAAGLQDKYWGMYGLLYQNQDLWKDSKNPLVMYTQYAKQLGMNVDKFKTDYASSQVNDLINADKAEGDKLGVQGTPTFFLNGKKVQINNNVVAFEKVIDTEIAKKFRAQ